MTDSATDCAPVEQPDREPLAQSVRTAIDLVDELRERERAEDARVLAAVEQARLDLESVRGLASEQSDAVREHHAAGRISDEVATELLYQIESTRIAAIEQWQIVEVVRYAWQHRARLVGPESLVSAEDLVEPAPTVDAAPQRRRPHLRIVK